MRDLPPPEASGFLVRGETRGPWLPRLSTLPLERVAKSSPKIPKSWRWRDRFGALAVSLSGPACASIGDRPVLGDDTLDHEGSTARRKARILVPRLGAPGVNRNEKNIVCRFCARDGVPA